MKNLTPLFAIFLLTVICSCDKDVTNNRVNEIPCLPKSLSNNVLAFYPFSKGSINDASGNNHHLINPTTAKPTSDRNSNDSCAYEFIDSPSSSEYLTTPATTFLNGLNEFSISLWYQPKDSSRAGEVSESLIKRDSAKSGPYRKGPWSINLHDCRKAVFSTTQSVWDKEITNHDCQQEVNIRTGIWHHLVATYKKKGAEMKLYRNGVLQEFSSCNGTCVPSTSNYNDIGDLFVGKDFTGKIDDVIIFNKTLTEQEVTMLFSLETCCER